MSELYVRLAALEIKPVHLEAYMMAIKEQIETAVGTELGVLVLYAVQDRKDPTRVTVFEIYRDIAAYEQHCRSAHFLHNKATTADMVRTLELKPVEPAVLCSKPFDGAVHGNERCDADEFVLIRQPNRSTKQRLGGPAPGCK